jgi:hypothetical protein
MHWYVCISLNICKWIYCAGYTVSICVYLHLHLQPSSTFPDPEWLSAFIVYCFTPNKINGAVDRSKPASKSIDRFQKDHCDQQSLVTPARTSSCLDGRAKTWNPEHTEWNAWIVDAICASITQLERAREKPKPTPNKKINSRGRTTRDVHVSYYHDKFLLRHMKCWVGRNSPTLPCFSAQ